MQQLRAVVAVPVTLPVVSFPVTDPTVKALVLAIVSKFRSTI